MEDTRIDIKVSPATHARLKQACAADGLTMDTVIGSALDGWEKLPAEERQKSAAVWMACRAFWQRMSSNNSRG